MEEKPIRTGRMAIVPGVMGPTRIQDPRGAIATREGAVKLWLDIRFDREVWRYYLHELRAKRVKELGGGPVTTEALQQVKVAMWIRAALEVDEGVIYQRPNPGAFDPWGLEVPEEVISAGVSERELRWASHLYRYGYAINASSPTEIVAERLGLARSTAPRWISLARQAGYLGPAEGPGKAGGGPARLPG